MKLTREQKDEIEALALKLYDRANPGWAQGRVINVSKAECIRQAEKTIRQRQQQQ